jgi:hypothetical protein
MRTIRAAPAAAHLLLAILATPVSRAALGAQRPARGDAPIAITGVTVIDVADGRRLTRQTVVVRGTRIAAMGRRGVRIPAGARIVDGRGRFLIPGLWDMHVHSAAAAARERPLYLALGVTGVRDMHSPSDGAPGLGSAAPSPLHEGAVVGPRVVAGGPVLDGVGSLVPGALLVRNAAEARRVVDSLAAAGADFIELYDFVPRDAFFGAVTQARQRGMAVAGRVPYAVSVAEAAEGGISSVERMRGLEYDCSPIGDSLRAEMVSLLADVAAGRAASTVLPPARERVLLAAVAARDEPRCARAIEMLRRHNGWVVPTLGWGSGDGAVVLGDTARMRYVPRETRAEWARILADEKKGPEPGWSKRSRTERANVPILRRVGVPILAGTGAGEYGLVAGFSLHDELAQLVATGLTPLEALRAATVNPARFMRASDSLGTVEAGKLADLVLLDGDPLASIRNTRRIRAVIANGRLYDRKGLNGLLEAVARAANPAAATSAK